MTREIGPQISPLMALQAIERIVGDDFCEDINCLLAFHPERVSDREKVSIEKLAAIYRIAHSNDPSHSCHHVHRGWRGETEAMLNAASEEERE